MLASKKVLLPLGEIESDDIGFKCIQVIQVDVFWSLMLTPLSHASVKGKRRCREKRTTFFFFFRFLFLFSRAPHPSCGCLSFLYQFVMRDAKQSWGKKKKFCSTLANVVRPYDESCENFVKLQHM